MMGLHLGCRLVFALGQPTPMILLLNAHSSRAGDLEQPDRLVATP
ncbi:hypothetical protein [Maliponia aquimaris]|uniref:Uncharacterized protein n=1 Tax=Maliponia aquimaris TaxID=1673631 RepID=A0A238K544_9RHOB|nr:hypothetical protein [Maliponia aquimaris]SMX38030.1 hypothetical protein MAA8898_01344 [Maliponia aquimaris]